MAVYVAFLMIAAMMFLFGRWGQKRAPSLAAAEREPARRLRKERALRRGAILWQIVACVFFVVTTIGAVVSY